jgi:hypothetical protein
LIFLAYVPALQQVQAEAPVKEEALPEAHPIQEDAPAVE